MPTAVVGVDCSERNAPSRGVAFPIIGESALLKHLVGFGSLPRMCSDFAGESFVPGLVCPLRAQRHNVP